MLSRSPDTAADVNSLPEFSRALGDLAKLTRMGQSFSGNERNCAYLNLGRNAVRFANVSAVSGFDFPHDARAVALVDWDHDGDLDAWLSSRTAPRVRLLRNETNSGHHYLKLRLEGRSCNRDAIGARVEVVLHDSSDLKNVKTMRAGEGFATQASKWLHFGLGSTSEIAKVIVHWPGGEAETFSGAAADGWYHAVQGTGELEPWQPPEREFRLVAGPPQLPKSAGKLRSVLAYPPPLPRLRYESLDGQEMSVGGRRERPLLISLWASDCKACLAELAELGQARASLKEAGLDLLALCVDGLADNQEKPLDASGAAQLLTSKGFAGAAGMANVEVLDKIYLTLDAIYVRDIPPSTPTSLLLDRDGRLAVVYRSRVGVEQLLADVAMLEESGADARLSSVPLAGSWMLSRYRQDSHMSRIAFALSAQGYEADSVGYLEDNLNLATDDPRYVRTLISVANALTEQDRYADAEAKYREALSLDPQEVDARAGLARTLAAQEKHEEAIELYRELIVLRPKDTDALVQLGISLQFMNQPDEALSLYQRALAIDPDHARGNLFLGKYLRYNRRPAEAVTRLQRAFDANVADAETRYELGMALVELERLDEGREHLLAAGRSEASLLGRMNNRAWQLAAGSDSSEAMRREAVLLAEIVVEASGQERPDLLDTLAVAYAAESRFDDAVATGEKALALAAASDRGKWLLPGIEARLELFRQAKPYHEAPAEN